MKNIMEMTWKEIDEVNKAKGILCITVAPIEEHGLHLPLGTDIYEGEHWIKLLAEKMESKYGIECYKSIPFYTASASANYPCSVHFSPKTTKLAVYELIKNFASQGWKNIILIASHGDPIHQVAVSAACDEVNKQFGVCAISPLSAFFSLGRNKVKFEVPEKIAKMESEFHDIHAGFVETSSMLYIKEELVKGIYKELPSTVIDERQMGDGKKIIEAMGEYGHLGAPKYADKAIGKALSENVAEYLVNAVMAFIKRKDFEQYEHHFLHDKLLGMTL